MAEVASPIVRIPVRAKALFTDRPHAWILHYINVDCALLYKWLPAALRWIKFELSRVVADLLLSFNFICRWFGQPPRVSRGQAGWRSLRHYSTFPIWPAHPDVLG
jgi:hypothetical protein